MTPKRKKKPTPIDSPRSTPSPALDGVSRTESVMVVTPPPQLLKPGSTPRQCVDVHAENRLKEGLLKVRGKETVKVMVRVRPFMPHEIAKSRDKGFSLEPTVAVTEKECSVVDDNGVVKDKYKFDRCFWSMPAEQASGPHVAGQADVFEVMGKPSVKHAFYGYNACIFAYGQTGSGKTHSMLGTDADPGLAPRIVRKIYDTIEGIQQDGEKTRFELRICFMEIYNEKVMDLLVDGTPKKKGVKSPRGDKYRECKVRYSPDKGTYVEGINRILVTSAAECLKLMHGGMAYRATAAHAMNDQSSRSHAIFQICLKQTTVLGTTLVSLVNIVDLAGSERVKMTKATGTVLDEAKNINLSLTTLRRVIDVLLSNAKKRTKDIPPYRESMLTWVLKDSLGGNSKTMMIAAVSPHRSNIDDTLNTLRYALKAKAILLHAQVNEEKTATMLKSMKAEIEALQRQIRSGSGGGEVSEAALESHKREFEEALQQAESAAEQAKQEAAEDHAYMETQVKDEKRKNFAAAFRNAFAISRRKDETAALISSLKEELHREREARRQAEESKRKAEEALEQQEEKYRDNTRDKKIKIQVQQQTINDAKVYTQELRVSGHKLEMKNDELATEARHLREALKTERENTKHAQATVKSLQVSVAGLHDKNSNEMLELQDARNAIEMLHNKLKSAESRIRNQEQQNRELSKSATTHHDDKLQAEKSLQLTIERLMEKNGELEQQLQAKQSMISSLKRNIHDLKDDYCYLSSEKRLKDDAFVSLKATEREVQKTMVFQATDLQEIEDENLRLREALDRHDHLSTRSRSPSVSMPRGYGAEVRCESAARHVGTPPDDAMYLDFKDYMASSFFPSGRQRAGSVTSPSLPSPGCHQWTDKGGIYYGPSPGTPQRSPHHTPTRTPTRTPSPSPLRSGSRRRRPSSNLYCKNDKPAFR